MLSGGEVTNSNERGTHTCQRDGHLSPASCTAGEVVAVVAGVVVVVEVISVWPHAKGQS